jgi:O-antigen/teichoic acid export membrane protein
MDEADTVPAEPVPRLLRDSTLYFAGNVAGRVVSLIMIPFYASHLSPAEYGILSLVELATSIVAIVFGLQSVGQTLTRIYHDQDDAKARHEVVSTALLAAALAAIAVAALAVVLAQPIAVAINLPHEVNLLRASFLSMVFSTMAEVVLVYYRMRDRARFFLTYSMITLFATLALNILFIGHLGFGVWGFVSSKLVVTGLGSLFLLVLALREVGVAWTPRHANAMARFGAPLVLSSISYFAIHFSDRLFLAQVGQAQVGVYSLAYNFAFLLSILVGDSFGKTWNVTFYSYASGLGWQARFARIGTWLVFVLGTAAVGISLAGRDALRVIVPADYLPPLLMLPVLVFGYFFREIGDFFRNILLIDIGSGLVGRIALAMAAVNLALNWFLITGVFHLGIWGASLATAITWVLYCAVCWVAAGRLHRVPILVTPLLRMLALSAACLAMAVAVPFANAFVALAADIGWFAIFLVGSAFLYLNAGQRLEALALGRRGWEIGWDYIRTGR